MKTCCNYPPTGLIAIYYFCLWSFSQFQIRVTLFSSKAIIINLQVKDLDPLIQMLHWSPNTWRLFHPLHPVSSVTLSKRLFSWSGMICPLWTLLLKVQYSTVFSLFTDGPSLFPPLFCSILVHCLVACKYFIYFGLLSRKPKGKQLVESLCFLPVT